MKGFDGSPSLNPYPTNQYVSAPKTTSITFFVMMLTSNPGEDDPISKSPKPLCIVNMMKALVRTWCNEGRVM